MVRPPNLARSAARSSISLPEVPPRPGCPLARAGVRCIKWGFRGCADLHLVPTHLTRPIFTPSDDPPSATGCPSHAAAVSCLGIIAPFAAWSECSARRLPRGAEPEQKQLTLQAGAANNRSTHALHLHARPHIPLALFWKLPSSCCSTATVAERGPHPGQTRPHTATWGASIQIEHAPTQLLHHRCLQARSLLCL